MTTKPRSQKPKKAPPKPTAWFVSYRVRNPQTRANYNLSRIMEAATEAKAKKRFLEWLRECHPELEPVVSFNVVRYGYGTAGHGCFGQRSLADVLREARKDARDGTPNPTDPDPDAPRAA